MTDNNLNAYILQAIDPSGYDIQANTPEEKLQFLRNTFVREYGFNIKRMGEVRALEEWLSGLPSSINIVFNYYDIEQLGRSLGLLRKNASEKTIEAFTHSWFRNLAVNIYKLWNRKDNNQ
jgi:hypothetical protein